MSDQPVPVRPDYKHFHLAPDFDRYMPQIHPVALALLEHLPVAQGATVLDVACGSGEPGLMLARRTPGVRLLGIDSAAPMIAVAQSKADREALPNVRFEVMSFERLTLANASVDAVISRFGLLMFGDVPASARELVRVLRPRGPFSLAVWDDLAKNTLMNALLEVLGGYLPKEHRAPMDALSQWAREGVRTRLLKEAGIETVDSAPFSWTYAFMDFEEVWGLVCLMGTFTGQATLAADVQDRVKCELHEVLAPFRQDAGGYVIPHTCRLMWGRR